MSEGLKYDTGKPRTDLLPTDALLEVALVLDYGAKKYTKYGECTCRAKDFRSVNTGEDPVPAPAAATPTKRTSETAAQSSHKDNASRASPGDAPTPIESKSTASSSAPTAGSIEHSTTCGVHCVVRRGERNWEKGMAWGRLSGALLRHLFAWMNGEDRDPESGMRHLAHAACCALMLLSLTIRNVGTDDRENLDA